MLVYMCYMLTLTGWRCQNSVRSHRLRAVSTSIEPPPASQLTTAAPRYPKHVWSPSGGWYAQPKNWKSNTAVFMVGILGITAYFWSLSAERERRPRFPEPGRFFPSRLYVPCLEMGQFG